MKRKGVEEALRTLEVLTILYLMEHIQLEVLFDLVSLLTNTFNIFNRLGKATHNQIWAEVRLFSHVEDKPQLPGQPVNRWLCYLKDDGAINLITFMSSWSLRSFFELGSTMVRTSFSSRKVHNNNGHVSSWTYKGRVYCRKQPEEIKISLLNINKRARERLPNMVSSGSSS